MGGLDVDDRNGEVFQQYDIKINNMYRARGALLLDTDKGLLLYGQSNSSNQRLEFENFVKLHVREAGYEQVDVYLKNKEGLLVTADSTGTTYTIRQWYMGEECNLRDLNSMKKAADNLGILHKAMKEIYYDSQEKRGLSLTEVFRKRNRELKRVHTYILSKKQKNEFEYLFLQAFPNFYECGLEAESLLLDGIYDELQQEVIEHGEVYHGSYNQHNILFNKKGMITTNFDKADYGIQIIDLYQFLRKAMEKNAWNIHDGIAIIESYMQHMKLEPKRLKMLYILMLYPEKFWKITNHYYNNKKSWISGRSIQKLSIVKEQDVLKKIFLQYLVTYSK